MVSKFGGDQQTQKRVGSATATATAQSRKPSIAGGSGRRGSAVPVSDVMANGREPRAKDAACQTYDPENPEESRAFPSEPAVPVEWQLEGAEDAAKAEGAEEANPSWGTPASANTGCDCSVIPEEPPPITAFTRSVLTSSSESRAPTSL